MPTGIAIDSSDNVYITKKATDQIQKFDADGNLLAEFGGSRATRTVQFNDPSALARSVRTGTFTSPTQPIERIQKLDTSGSLLDPVGERR